MQLLTQILKQINDYVWGLPLICLLLGTVFTLPSN